MTLVNRRTKRASRKLADYSSALEYLNTERLHSLDKVRLEGDQVFHIEESVNLVLQRGQ